eukprot:8005499-Alexandrium_andersonii.AAC.1
MHGTPGERANEQHHPTGLREVSQHHLAVTECQSCHAQNYGLGAETGSDQVVPSEGASTRHTQSLRGKPFCCRGGGADIR